jgi:uncharacterized membrane protein
MRYQLLIIRLLTLIALAVSTAQLADQLSGAGAFCSFDGACEAVTTSAYGRPLGIPLSAVGVAGFSVLFILTLLPSPRAFGLVRPLALVAGVVGLALLTIQIAVLGRLCPLCVVVDVCSVGLAITALLHRSEPDSPVRLRLIGWIAGGVGAVFIPTVWSLSEAPPPVPEQVKAYWRPGRVTVVELMDFDCSHCRDADLVFKAVLPHHDVDFVRIVAPMPMHENARPAGRAYHAAVLQGKGEEMAKALFAAPSRSAAKCRELAAGIGLDLAEYDRVLKEGSADVEFNATLAWADHLGKGLPVVWVQDRLIQGVPTPWGLDSELRHAKPFDK